MYTAIAATLIPPIRMRNNVVIVKLLHKTHNIIFFYNYIQYRTSLSLKDTDWDELLYSINDRVHPFIGAGACTFSNKDKNN